jgi:hypothetical protein
MAGLVSRHWLLCGSAPGEFGMRERRDVPLQDADEQPMRKPLTSTVVRDVSTDETRAADIAMHQGDRRTVWLQPVEVLQIT